MEQYRTTNLNQETIFQYQQQHHHLHQQHHQLDHHQQQYHQYHQQGGQVYEKQYENQYAQEYEQQYEEVDRLDQPIEELDTMKSIPRRRNTPNGSSSTSASDSKSSFLQEQIDKHASLQRKCDSKQSHLQDQINQQLSIRRDSAGKYQAQSQLSQKSNVAASRSCDNSPINSPKESNIRRLNRSKSDDGPLINNSYPNNDTLEHPTLNKFISMSMQREREGKCLTCGRQLFMIKLKTKAISAWFRPSSGDTNIDTMSNEEFYKQYKRLPLTIPGQVERGQCLFCGTSTTCTNGKNSSDNPCSLAGTSVSTTTNNASHSSLGNTNVDVSNLLIDDIDEQQDHHLVSGYAEYTKQQQQHQQLQQQHQQNNAEAGNNHTGKVGNNNANSGQDKSNNNNGVTTNHDPFAILQNVNATALYQGSYNAAGKRHGHGKMTWSNNGDIYVGDFVNGDRHGNGTLHFGGIDGGEYVGEWLHNQMSGLGTRRWPNGDCYTGDYLGGQRTGSGRFYFANGDMYTGEFYEDKIHGFGRYYYANGQRFEGYFYHGKRLGKGKLQRNDGTLDVGVYKGDVRVGAGVRWSPDRTETWRLENGIVKKKITVAEAVSLDYEIDAAADEINAELEVV